MAENRIQRLLRRAAGKAADATVGEQPMNNLRRRLRQGQQATQKKAAPKRKPR